MSGVLVAIHTHLLLERQDHKEKEGLQEIWKKVKSKFEVSET